MRPAKADAFGGSQTRQGKSQSLVARMAGRRETESLKPIDKAIFGMAASHRAVAQANTDVAPKRRGSRRSSLQPRGEDSMTDRNLAETVRHSGGVEVTAR